MERKTTRLDGQLCKAVDDGDPRSVQLLLSQGACPDRVGSKGLAAMHLAAGKETEKNTRCLKMLLQHGADPNVRSEGLTPLHIAALWGCYQNLKLLLMNGGNPNLKDNEGNTPGQLAEQQENRKCAQLLQEYQCSSVDTEEDDFPQFQYSVYSDQTDTSSYPESDYSFSSHSSVISDFGEAPLSSTRRSSFFNLSNINGRPNCRGISYNRLSDMDGKRHWDNSSSHWAPEGPSILSSTRMSTAGPAAALPVLQEDALFIDDGAFTSNAAGRISPSRRDTLPAFPSRRASRKSVSFRDVDEYFPVFSPESPKRPPAVDDSHYTSTLPFDMSEYSDFLSSERMATVLHKQGIDVTSPDHVYVFCRESSESTEDDLEKTVLSRCALEESDDEQEGERVKDARADVPEQPARSHVGSSSSGTGSSHYSSCDSDHYTSALDASVHPRRLLVPEREQISTDSDSDLNPPPVETEPQIDSLKTTEHLPDTCDKLDEVKHPTNGVFEACSGPTSSDSGVEQLADAFQENFNISSPFVTGRTRSRLSRCSMRTSRTPESLLATSSLFEETLPTPVRTRRQTPRSQSSEDFYSSPHAHTSTGGDDLPADSQDTQSSTLRAGSSVSDSQADTFILPKSVQSSTLGAGSSVGESQADTFILPKSVQSSTLGAGSSVGESQADTFILPKSPAGSSESQTLSDTVAVEENQDSLTDAYERNLAEIILAMQGRDTADGRDFLTDDLTSTDETTAKRSVNEAPCEDKVESLKNEDLWITEDYSSQPDSVSSSSSSYFSPRRSREDSDLPCTPGTGCTPRYSMSRLSSCRRPQHLADLSYTPGGRPHIQDLDEPVEYLYTDSEQGHKLIETHVPPTANTSLSSSMSASSSEETILYDWRSMHSDMKTRGKENQKPQMVPQKEESDKDRLLPETRGMTDKELRLRLVELGESPGPISCRTRPTYMRRLCRLLQDSQSPRPQKQSEQPQTGSADLGYSPELCRALRTFELPDCHADEQALCQQFDQPDQNRKWREGIIKSSFNYLLLDPRVTKNLPFRSHTMTPQECFQTFIHAIFYVGKGKRSRPYSHLYEALEYFKGDKTSKKLCRKVQHILQVWKAGQGVISLHCFQNVIPVEAYTREACMVEAIGLKMLTNQKRGDFYGVVSNWQAKKKRDLGVHLLYRAMQIFLAEGERQLRPADIRQ